MHASSDRKSGTVTGVYAGLSLLELLVAVAILGIVAAVALPLYRGYVESAATGALVNDIATMEVFQEDALLRSGSYAEGTYDAGSGVTSLTDATGWRPRADTRVVYVVDEATPSGYRVTATDTDGRSICRVMPARTPC